MSVDLQEAPATVVTAAPGAPPSGQSEPELLVHVSGVGKKYHLWERPSTRLWYSVLSQVHRPLRATLPAGSPLLAAVARKRDAISHHFTALEDVSFELRRGESVGIIGRNGSGKSTLLQIIAGTLCPSSGQVEVRGRVAALLELGSGFNHEFTGRENVYLNAAILGLSRDETQEHFEEIVAFAEIGDFLDQPVKTYSSGMMMRLAFAVSVCLEPDILIVDEALAVGDVFFSQKCFRRMEALRAKGVSILLVSHAMSAVVQFCQRCVLLEAGRVHSQGDPSEVVKRYYLINQRQGRRSSASAETAAGAAALLDDAGEQELAEDRADAENLPAGASETAQAEDTADWWCHDLESLDLRGRAQVSDGDARCTFVQVCNMAGEPCRHFAQGERAVFFYEFEVRHAIELPVSGLTLLHRTGVLVHGKHGLQYPAEALPTAVPSGGRLRVRQEVALRVDTGDYTLEVGLAATDSKTYEEHRRDPHPGLESRMLRLCHVPAAAALSVGPPARWERFPLLHYGNADLPGSYRAQSLPPRSGGPLADEGKSDLAGRRPSHGVVDPRTPF